MKKKEIRRRIKGIAADWGVDYKPLKKQIEVKAKKTADPKLATEEILDTLQYNASCPICGKQMHICTETAGKRNAYTVTADCRVICYECYYKEQKEI